MKHHSGRIEVVCGSMFSGKTEELLRRVRRAQIAQQRVQVFKPALDTRYGEMRITSHDGKGFEAYPCESIAEMAARLDTTATVIAIDEVQFFEAGIVPFVEDLARRGRRVIVAGLDTDFRGEPFGQMPTLMAVAEEVTKLHAICVVCGEPACRTQRLLNGKPAHYDDPIILIGAQDSYEARCREHHVVVRESSRVTG
ncbi:MAG TPA: thymidine kinase [Aggregatilineales bacterium]|nr:thymidine kinase [Anaerolineales bacterium]HRE46892.1 thymidine kinase [Aggregatilineales bacterium]